MMRCLADCTRIRGEPQEQVAVVEQPGRARAIGWYQTLLLDMMVSDTSARYDGIGYLCSI
jgi:hypothetical protein